MVTHISRYLRHYPPVSPGHIYQDRYKNVLVEHGAPVVQVNRYVEANALNAGIVERAQDYAWSSASPMALDDRRPFIADWPVAKPANWNTLLNLRTLSAERRKIQRCASRGAPYGSPEWTAAVVKQFGLEHTLRRPGRPNGHETIVPTEELASLG
jgi:putative transposase